MILRRVLHRDGDGRLPRRLPLGGGRAGECGIPLPAARGYGLGARDGPHATHLAERAALYLELSV